MSDNRKAVVIRNKKSNRVMTVFENSFLHKDAMKPHSNFEVLETDPDNIEIPQKLAAVTEGPKKKVAQEKAVDVAPVEKVEDNDASSNEESQQGADEAPKAEATKEEKPKKKGGRPPKAKSK